MKLKLISALAAGLLVAAPSFAATLDFQDAGDYNFIGDFYNGGTNDAGASGPNYGISFGADAFAFANGDFTYFSHEPTPGALSAVTPFVGTTDASLNVSAGFSGQASFWYSASTETTVAVYSGLNGTGTQLGTFTLLANAQNGCSDTAFCHWDLTSLDLGSSVAKSIQFANIADGVAVVDNVTVNAVPLPAAAWMLVSALGSLGVVRRKRAA